MTECFGININTKTFLVDKNLEKFRIIDGQYVFEFSHQSYLHLIKLFKKFKHDPEKNESRQNLYNVDDYAVVYEKNLFIIHSKDTSQIC